MKKFCLLSTVLLASSAYASTHYAYIGIDANYLNTQFKHKVVSRYYSPQVSETVNSSRDTGAWGLLAGYSWFFNRFNLAGELFYNDDNVVHRYYGRTTENINHFLYDFGATVIPGYQIVSELNLQAIIGFSEGYFQFHSTGRTNVTNNYSEPGFLIGAGLDYTISQHFHTQLRYEYTDYANKNNISGTEDYFDREGNAVTNRVILGLTYLFN